MEVKAILPTAANQENLAHLWGGKLYGEAQKCIFGSTYATIEELIEKLKRVRGLFNKSMTSRQMVLLS